MNEWLPICIHNGRQKKLADRTINITSEAVQFGYGIFDTLKIENGTSPFLAKHFQRLTTQSEKLGLRFNLTQWKYRKAINQLWTANKKPDRAICRTTLLKNGHKTVQTILLRKYKISEILYSRGVKIKLIQKTSEPSFISGLKTLNYLDNLITRTTFQNKKYFETIFYNNKGFITEGSASNIFFVRKNGSIVTPPLKSRILSGITRSTVILILRRKNIPVEETPVPVKNIRIFQEIFITNSVYDILPVRHISGITFTDLSLSRQILSEFQNIWSKKVQ